MTENGFPNLKSGRSHELTGAAASSFAAIFAGGCSGPVMWISEGWQREELHPSGFAQFCDPQKLLLVKAKGETDLLASFEETLRSGVMSVVIAELNTALGLTAGRRLQLAAKAGRATGLSIIPEGMGSNAAETRWRCNPLYDPDDSTLQQWELIKNKSGTLGIWDVRWNAEARRIIMVSKVGQRSGSAYPPG